MFLLNANPFFFGEPPPGLLYFLLPILLIASTAGIVAGLGFFRLLRQAGIFAWIAVLSFVTAEALGIVLNVLGTTLGSRGLALGNTTLLASGVAVLFFSIASLRVQSISRRLSKLGIAVGVLTWLGTWLLGPLAPSVLLATQFESLSIRETDELADLAESVATFPGALLFSVWMVWMGVVLLRTARERPPPQIPPPPPRDSRQAMADDVVETV